MGNYTERPWVAPKHINYDVGPRKPGMGFEDHNHRVPKHGKLFTCNRCFNTRIVNVQKHEDWHNRNK